MFGDRSGQVVIDDFSGDTAQHSESVNVAANESFESLAVGELDVEGTAVRIHQREGIEFALVARIIERSEISTTNVANEALFQRSTPAVYD